MFGIGIGFFFYECFIFGAGKILPGASFEELAFGFVLFVIFVINWIEFVLLIMISPCVLGIVGKGRNGLFIKGRLSELIFQEFLEILFGACNGPFLKLNCLFQVGV